MRFDRLLIHRCTLINPGQVVGKDIYNRDIIQDVPKENVSCRLNQVKRRLSSDTYGTDVVVDNVLFLSPDEKISDSIKVQDLKDKDGNFLLAGVYEAENINPIYGRRRLHHYEVTLKKVGD